MRLILITLALFSDINNNGVTVSAFSRTHHHHSIVPSSLYDSCKHQIQPPPFRRKNTNCHHSGRLRLKCTQALSDNGDTDLAVTSNANDVSKYFNYLRSQFQGDFDNYNQVVQDRRHGLTPGEGGGHENIHCTLVPCPQYDTIIGDQKRWILAAFYFNGNPRQIFRFRVYQLIPPSSNELSVRMKLHTLLPELEQQLRQCSDQPCMWWKEVWNVWCKSNKGKVDAEEWNEFQTVGVPAMVSPLEGCDVLWDPNWDPSKHSYLYTDEYGDSPRAPAASTQPELPPGQSCHAIMEAGSKGAIVDSVSMIPGKRLLIKDELSLWNDEFWINDRGYDPDVVLEEKELGDIMKGNSDGMPFVYGNRRGVPYKLQKVSDFSSWNDTGNLEQPSPDIADIESSLTLERVIANDDLKWTLGEEYRTLDLYQKKMQAVDKALE